MENNFNIKDQSGCIPSDILVKDKFDSEVISKAVEDLKEICIDIGCSGMDPDMCKKHPHKCDIIKKIMGKMKIEKCKKKGCHGNMYCFSRR